MKLLKVILVIFVILAVIAAVGLYALTRYVERPEFRQKLVGLASKATGTTVKLDDLKVSLFSGIELRGMALGNPGGFAGDFVTARAFVLRYRLWPLLRSLGARSWADLGLVSGPREGRRLWVGLGLGFLSLALVACQSEGLVKDGDTVLALAITAHMVNLVLLGLFGALAYSQVRAQVPDLGRWLRYPLERGRPS